MKYSNLIVIVLLLIGNVYSQQGKKSLSSESYVEVVLIEDETLVNFISSLNLKDEKCIKEGNYWYIEFEDYKNRETKENYISISNGGLKTLINPINKNEKLYLTIINNEMLFISFKNKKSLPPLEKTGLFLYFDKSKTARPYFMRITMWILEERNDKIEVIHSEKHHCD